MIFAQVQALQERWQRLLTMMLHQAGDRLILRLTAVLIVLHEIDTFPWLRLPERLLALAILFIPRWIDSKSAWIALSSLLVLNNIWSWSSLVNHEYLTTYWVLACTLALYAANPKKVMAWNGRLLIGLCFALATLWKFLGGEYLDGSFLHLTFLLDSRLSMGAWLLGGLGEDTLAQNRAMFDTMQTVGNVEPQLLQTSPRMALVSLILSYWTIIIEAIVALSFLVPFPKILVRYRYALLLVFMFTTYTVIPVLAFGSLLLIMGLAQCLQEDSPWSSIYLGALLLLPIWMPLPQLIFSLFQNL